jgi:2-oxoglutarate dehydrogenase complex dehydrogenase (E1) component-like enzyme
MRGHKIAQLDPLGLSSADLDSERPNDLTFRFYNFSKNSKSDKTKYISS